MVRVGAGQYEEALSRPHAREMNFTGRPMKGFVYVLPDGFKTDEELRSWVSRYEAFLRSFPPK